MTSLLELLEEEDRLIAKLNRERELLAINNAELRASAHYIENDAKERQDQVHRDKILEHTSNILVLNSDITSIRNNIREALESILSTTHEIKGE